MGSPKIPEVEGVVTSNFKYMNYSEHDDEELYDTAHDPHETTKLARDAALAQQLKAIRRTETDGSVGNCMFVGKSDRGKQIAKYDRNTFIW